VLRLEAAAVPIGPGAAATAHRRAVLR
ncbi:MAG: hypothetical protein QOF76_119, partial [Solirubrobacteraceae bacterium]|nr:hypothetical protein [Solirubrobacteraceae bacterium]